MYQISDEAARRIVAAYLDISRTYDSLSAAAQKDTVISYWWSLLLTAAEELHVAGEPLMLHQLPGGVTEKRSDLWPKRKRKRRAKAVATPAEALANLALAALTAAPEDKG